MQIKGVTRDVQCGYYKFRFTHDSQFPIEVEKVNVGEPQYDTFQSSLKDIPRSAAVVDDYDFLPFVDICHGSDQTSPPTQHLWTFRGQAEFVGYVGSFSAATQRVIHLIVTFVP